MDCVLTLYNNPHFLAFPLEMLPFLNYFHLQSTYKVMFVFTESNKCIQDCSIILAERENLASIKKYLKTQFFEKNRSTLRCDIFRPGLSLRAVTHNTSYSQVCFIYFPLMLRVKLPVVDIIQPQSNKCGERGHR